MPRRTDIRSILIIGSGPIVIGQGCEFDYSGVQACRALREEGYRIVLINSNPATIMTDPEFADATYIEPITPEAVEKILEREKATGTPIDALLPTLGGQTGLNTGMACWDKGILQKYGVKMIGANRDAIHRGEDRQVFKELMLSIGLKVPRSGVVHTMSDAMRVLEDIGLPLIIRPAFTLGGTGGGIAYNREEFEEIVQRGLDASPVTEVLIEQSVIGWKEYEMEVMRDKNDNVVIICSIENIDAMGVHTGDSITVAPIQTLTDKEYQRMRDASIAVIRAVGVETGGSNIQFGINPDSGDMVVIEMNPRVSRSSALASKATGYPIAKLAAKLAVGYTLDELPNYITSRLNPVNPKSEIRNPKSGSTQDAYESWTSACFEPTIDYCVIKIPRWTFEKFPDADETLTTQMKSVGEAMAIGRTFKEALQKGIRSMEVKRFGFGLDKYDKWLNAGKEVRSGTGAPPVQQKTGEHGRGAHATKEGKPPAQGRTQTLAPQREPTDRQNWDAVGDRRAAVEDASDKTTQGESLDHEWPIPPDKLRRKLAVPSQGRLYYVRYALKMGWTIDQIYELTKIDRWFLGQMKQLVDFEGEVMRVGGAASKLVRSGAERKSSPTVSRVLRQAKQWGYSDIQLSAVWQLGANEVRELREELHIWPVYKLVDTCAAEFEASTPYYYSSYEVPFAITGAKARYDAVLAGQTLILPREGSATTTEDEIRLTDRPKVIIIGGGPNRIGQGIEFDYCCVQAAFALRELGIESVMINSNPETVSTDYDTSDLLFFEPLTHEDILNICERLNGGSFNKQLHIYSSDDVTTVERDTLDHELKRRDLLPAAVMQVMRSDKGKEADSAFLMFSKKRWPFILVLGSDGKVREWIDDASSYAKDAIYRDPDEADRLAWWNQLGGLVKGVIVQFGGQTPLNLARGLQEAGVPIIGTSVDSIDAAGDREQFRDLLKRLGLKQPENGIARNIAEARAIAKRIGYPVLVRPSFVLGGRAMEIVSDEAQLNFYMTYAVEASGDSPILIDKFLDAATEVDVDCLADYAPETPMEPDRSGPDRGETPRLSQAIIIGVMEHIEEAGIHSGDSACALPPYSLSPEIVAKLKDQTRALAQALRVRGLMNVQYAIRDGEIYVIEVNPRASRTVPFVGKATGVPWAKIAAKVMAGKTLAELGVTEQPDPAHTSVKEAVFPFSKFPGVDVILGPEMRSTGEVMGIDRDFPMAFAKSQLAAGNLLPTKGTVFISVRDGDKDAIIPVARMLADSGFEIIASSGTHAALAKHDIPSARISKLAEGRPNIKDFIKNGKVGLIVNTPTRKGPQTDEGKIRALAVLNKIPIVTTITGANAAARAIQAMQANDWGVRPLQDYFADRPAPATQGPH